MSTDEQLRILLADDSTEIRLILREHLSDRGWEIFEATDGAEALETILVEKPHLIILDVMMPELNGWEVLKYLRSKPHIKDTKVLMLTGVGAKVNSLTSPLFGADLYLDKPFDLDVLDEKLDVLTAEL